MTWAPSTRRDIALMFESLSVFDVWGKLGYSLDKSDSDAEREYVREYQRAYQRERKRRKTAPARASRREQRDALVPQQHQRAAQPPGAERAQLLEQGRVEVGDAAGLERERAGLAIGGLQAQLMLDEVQCDLELAMITDRHRRGRQPAGLKAQRAVPPMIDRRTQSDAELAEHLRPAMQRLVGRLPIGEGQGWPFCVLHDCPPITASASSKRRGWRRFAAQVLLLRQAWKRNHSAAPKVDPTTCLTPLRRGSPRRHGTRSTRLVGSRFQPAIRQPTGPSLQPRRGWLL